MKKKIILYVLLVFFIALGGFSLFHIIQWIYDNQKTDSQIRQLQDIVSISDVVSSEEDKNQIDFSSLLEKNKDVVGWIYIPNTNVNYPFLQYKNNSYYLNHSFDQSYNTAGWVYMDYRNNLSDLDQNTILYAHGRVDGTMFGSLKELLHSSWNRESDRYIYLSTLDSSYIFEIFSLYTIPTTDDYLNNNFSSVSLYEDFLDMIVKRSVSSFDENLSSEDKILTLSTCYSNSEKMVVHGKLIKQEKRN